MPLNVYEIFESIQGESSYSGLPCLFIRLAGCNLRCSWCDTKYAYDDGTQLENDEVACRINKSKLRIVEFTGGEPLLQKKELIKVISMIDSEKTVMIETNGSISLENIPERAVKIVDIKLSGSGEGGSFLEENLKFIGKKDEIKFVLKDKFDYNEFRKYYREFDLDNMCSVLVSTVSGSGLSGADIAAELVKDRLNARFQIQLHKYLWKDERGR